LHKKNLTETVRNGKEYHPKHFARPPLSSKKNSWKSKNKWFEKEVLPGLKNVV